MCCCLLTVYRANRNQSCNTAPGHNYTKKSKQVILENSFSSFEWRNSRVHWKHTAVVHNAQIFINAIYWGSGVLFFLYCTYPANWWIVFPTGKCLPLSIGTTQAFTGSTQLSGIRILNRPKPSVGIQWSLKGSPKNVNVSQNLVYSASKFGWHSIQL